MKHSFLTISYKNEYIQCDGEEVKWNGHVYKSVHAAKCAITRLQAPYISDTPKNKIMKQKTAYKTLADLIRKCTTKEELKKCEDRITYHYDELATLTRKELARLDRLVMDQSVKIKKLNAPRGTI